MEKKTSFRIPDAEAHTVMIGAKTGSDKNVELMEAIGKEKMLTVTFSQVSGWVPLLHGQTSMLQKMKNLTKKKQDVQEAAKPQQKQVLYAGLSNPCARHDSTCDHQQCLQIMFKLAGACYPGEVLALMGPSGSGKTSLLSVIGGRTPKSVNLEGEILYNNARLTKTYKRSVGYVLQVQVNPCATVGIATSCDLHTNL